MKLKKFEKIDKIRFFRLIDIIIRCGVGMLGDDSAIKAAYEITQLRPPSEHFMTKTKSTLKQIVRDWTKEGGFTFQLFFASSFTGWTKKRVDFCNFLSHKFF